MNDANPHRVSSATFSDLVEALRVMRDALVKTSLTLQDYQFHLDEVRRHVAVEHTNELIEKVKAR